MNNQTALPADFRTATGNIDVARIKDRMPISGVAGKLTRLKPSGPGMKGLCPLHEERTPSFYVDDAKGVFYCFGCGQGGDVIDLVRIMSQGTFVEACEWLVGSELTCPAIHRKPVRKAAAQRAVNIGLAKAEWRTASPLAGSPAQVYLNSRGLGGTVVGSLRFGRTPAAFDPTTNKPGLRIPAMIAACQDVDGHVTGIQRTFLRRDGMRMQMPRLNLGQIRGGALRLGPEAAEIMLCEGIEDGLTLTRMFPGATVWVALGAGNMAHVALPTIVKRIVLAGDNDKPGRAAVNTAREAFEARRIDVDEIWPKAGARDFNQEWLLLHA